MSIPRIGRSIACTCSTCGSHTIRTITSTIVAFKKNVTPEQAGFQGLSSGFLYDEKNGFGYNKDGELVIVTPDATTFTKATSSYTSDIETKAFLEAVKDNYDNVKEPVKDFKVPLKDSLSDDETEYFLNAAKNSYPDGKNDKKKE